MVTGWLMKEKFIMNVEQRAGGTYRAKTGGLTWGEHLCGIVHLLDLLRGHVHIAVHHCRLVLRGREVGKVKPPNKASQL